jgi:hypothetical protein
MVFPLKILYIGLFQALIPNNSKLISSMGSSNSAGAWWCYRDWWKGTSCSFDKVIEQSAIQMVSPFSTSTKLVLAQQKVDEK